MFRNLVDTTMLLLRLVFSVLSECINEVFRIFHQLKLSFNNNTTQEAHVLNFCHVKIKDLKIRRNINQFYLDYEKLAAQCANI